MRMDREPELIMYRGKYAAYFPISGRRRSLRTADRALALQRFEEYRKLVRRKPTDVDAVLSAYIKDMETRPDPARNPETARYAAKALAPIFGSLHPDQITREHCRAFTADRREAGNSDGTTIRQLNVLRAAVRWNNPQTPSQFELPPTPDPDDRYLTREQVKRLLEHCKSPHIELFIHLAIATGARAGAILELTWDRIDLESGRINLGRGHGNKRRSIIPITNKLRSMLEAVEGPREGHLITYHGKPIATVKKSIQRLMVAAGLPSTGPRIFRHSAAVWMAQDRVPMAEIAAYLGHASSATTEKHYAKFSPDYLRGAASSLEL